MDGGLGGVGWDGTGFFLAVCRWLGEMVEKVDGMRCSAAEVEGAPSARCSQDQRRSGSFLTADWIMAHTLGGSISLIRGQGVAKSPAAAGALHGPASLSAKRVLGVAPGPDLAHRPPPAHGHCHLSPQRPPRTHRGSTPRRCILP